MSMLKVDDLKNVAVERFSQTRVAALAGVVATMMPVTAGVHGYFEKTRDVEVQEKRLEQELQLANMSRTNELRLGYLDRMHEPGQAACVLRMAQIAAQRPEIKAWAEQELAYLKADAEALKAETARHEEEAEQAWETALKTADPHERAAIYLERARRKADLAERLATRLLVTNVVSQEVEQLPLAPQRAF